MIPQVVETVLESVKAVMPKSSETEKRERLRDLMNSEAGLAGILWPSMLESSGYYYAGMLHQGWLRSGGFVINLVLELGRCCDRLRLEQKNENSPHYEFLSGRNFDMAGQATTTVMAAMKRILSEPENGGVIIETKEDERTKMMRLKRADVKRVMQALSLAFPSLFADPALRFLLESYLNLWQYTLHLLNTPLDILGVYNVADARVLANELSRVHNALNAITNALRPPVSSKRQGEWWVWSHTLSLHVYLVHMLKTFQQRLIFGDQTEVCFENKHCQTKVAAHDFSRSVLGMIENVALADLSRINARGPEDCIVSHVIRTHKLYLDDRETTKRQGERAAALESLKKVEACIARGSAVRAEQPVPDWAAADCEAVLAEPFANLFVESEVDIPTTNLATVRLPDPSFKFPNKWISPFYLWKGLVGAKETRLYENEGGADDREADANLPHDDDHAVRLEIELEDNDMEEGTVGDDDRQQTQVEELGEELDAEEQEDAMDDFINLVDPLDVEPEAPTGRGQRARSAKTDLNFVY